jgi:hypothetical protein
MKKYSLILIAIVTLISCRLTKSSKSSQDRSITATNKDSGQIKNTQFADDKSKQYERTTYIYPTKDTNVTNNFIYPTTVIHEKGVEHDHTTNNSYDSSYKNQKDTSSHIIQQSSSSSKLKVLGVWDVIGISIGGAAVTIFLSKIGKRIKFV